VYVAGALFAEDHYAIRLNIDRAAAIGLEVAKSGASPVIPHTNTGAWYIGTISHEFWYEATLELMRRCDAIVLVPGWQGSKGTKAEIEEAKRLNLPVFDTIAALSAWLQDQDVKLGSSVRVGRNEQYPDKPLFVGVHEHGSWKSFGAGATWNEAFAAVKKVKLQKADQSFVFEEG
jgi:hypothetical protein